MSAREPAPAGALESGQSGQSGGSAWSPGSSASSSSVARFPLEPSLAAKRSDCVVGEATRVDPERRAITVAGEELAYDFLVIATGHRSADEAVPGLRPFDGPGHSLMSPREAVEARRTSRGS